MDVAAVGAQGARAKEVVHLHAAPGLHHLVGIGGAGSLHGLEVVHRGRVVGGLDFGGAALGFLHVGIGKFARCVIHVPVPAGDELHAGCVLQAQAVDVAVEDEQRRDLHRLVDAEFLGRLDGVDGVATGIGQCQYLGLGALRLQQEGREVGGIERVAHGCSHCAALGLDDLGGIGFHCMAEGIVGRQKEPVLATALDNGARRTLGQRHGVIGVVDGVRRAGLVGQRRGARAVVDHHALFLVRHLGQRQRGAGVGTAEDHRQVLGVDPFAGLAGSDVGLVLVVHHQHFDRLAQHLAAKVVNGHLDGSGATLAFNVGIETGHVGDVADLDLVLRMGGTHRGGQAEQSEGGQGLRQASALHSCS